MTDQQEPQPATPSAQNKRFDMPLSQAPRWQQIVLVGLFAAGILSGIYLLAEPYIKPKQYPPYVAQIEELAARLQQASDTGDRATAIALYEPVAQLLYSMGNEPSIRDGSRRYCMVALAGMAQTMDQVVDGGRWDRSTFDNAMRGCKK